MALQKRRLTASAPSAVRGVRLPLRNWLRSRPSAATEHSPSSSNREEIRGLELAPARTMRATAPGMLTPRHESAGDRQAPQRPRNRRQRRTRVNPKAELRADRQWRPGDRRTGASRNWRKPGTLRPPDDVGVGPQLSAMQARPLCPASARRRVRFDARSTRLCVAVSAQLGALDLHPSCAASVRSPVHADAGCSSRHRFGGNESNGSRRARACPLDLQRQARD
jgi:hypothetical protein